MGRRREGGAIKRVTEKLDPRGYVVYPISAPHGEDKTRHYLYRFWRRLPENGRSRFLTAPGTVGCSSSTWRDSPPRASGSEPTKRINSFERQLRDFGTIVAKFWVHISREEQLRRFEERKTLGYKSWKLTDEDWRNREKWAPTKKLSKRCWSKPARALHLGAQLKEMTSIGHEREYWLNS